MRIRYSYIVLSIILFSCSGSNKYLIKNCNCDFYEFATDKCELKIDAIYSFNENQLFSEVGINIKNNSRNDIYFDNVNNILKSEIFRLKNVTKDTIIKMEPGDTKSFNLLFWGELINGKSPKHDVQKLTIDGFEINNEKIKIEEIILETTTWDY